ncbi:DUF4097 family beta strand repeat-containing protein [Pseudobdellovibrio exovorus]|uniref:DUF4097 domain-containing protein n=1 Tax=Pseudobdellovibrio exovorus JSS TaxID=1184267 RepID=M4VAI4_9BACT|nr:DUF4097 family beta strand repeat-containing protein [Pseudobdellovibrio exovorus]AGH96417.1 hypothetical protein A11Q_2201 [Pseudobdellovibrio exovorus JSS]
MGKIALGVFIATLASSVLSVGFAGLAGEAGFIRLAQAAEAKYSKSGSTGKSEVQSYTIEESFAAENFKELAITSITTDIRITPSTDGKIHLRYSYKTFDVPKTREEILGIIWKPEGSEARFQLDQSAGDERSWKAKLAELVKLGFRADDAKAEIKLPPSILKVQFKSVSGDFKTEDIKLQSLEATTVSGDVDVEGQIHQLKGKSVSGDLEFKSELASPQVEFSTTSGDMEVEFKKIEPNINVSFETTSGSMKSINQRLQGNVKEHLLGQGVGQVKLKSVSGDVEISVDKF